MKKERSQELKETLGEQILYAVFFTQADFFLEILQDLQVQLAFWNFGHGGLENRLMQQPKQPKMSAELRCSDDVSSTISKV